MAAVCRALMRSMGRRGSLCGPRKGLPGGVGVKGPITSAPARRVPQGPSNLTSDGKQTYFPAIPSSRTVELSGKVRNRRRS